MTLDCRLPGHQLNTQPVVNSTGRRGVQDESLRTAFASYSMMSQINLICNNVIRVNIYEE